MPKISVYVTGDAVCDHSFYNGQRPTADSDKTPGFRYSVTGGGALLLKDIIEAVTKEDNIAVEYGLDASYRKLPMSHHAFSLWELDDTEKPCSDDKQKTYECWHAIKPELGYGQKGFQPQGEDAHELNKESIIHRSPRLSRAPSILVIDDAGNGFNDPKYKKEWFPGCARKAPEWVVLKLSGNLHYGEMWDKIVEKYGERLIVVIPAVHLRRKNSRISLGHSWESTAMELAAELRKNPELSKLKEAQHLVVTFESDAAFWRKPNDEPSMLVFDAVLAEGQWAEEQKTGGVFGYSSCFTAAVVRELAKDPGNEKPDLERALSAGLGAARELHRFGHVILKDKNKELEDIPKLPYREIAKKMSDYDKPVPEEKFVSALIPSEKIDRTKWAMLNEWQVKAHDSNKSRPHFDAALAVAVLGTNALERFPVAQFGNFRTVDRGEIESLRNLCQLIKKHINGAPKDSPLNLGVFGPPGSGKSFIVEEFAAASGIPKKNIILFNLSQFDDPSDLIGAFHLVRDKVLSGVTPLVFWDEFDSQGYRWLQYLLAPMEDGKFQDGQTLHPIGHCVFVFAGATSYTFEKFGPIDPRDMSEKETILLQKDKPELLQDIEDKWNEFKLKKGPDFKSRVVSYIDLLGMNPRQVCIEAEGRRKWVDDETDLCFPIRRALFMRALLLGKNQDKQLDLDRSVVKALLEIKKYKGAGRSLQFLCKCLKGTGGMARSSLPSHSLLNMHVDTDEFWALCDRDRKLSTENIQELAKALHEDWRKNEATKKNNPFNKPWEKLDDEGREANIQQALRISSNLGICNLKFVKKTDPSPEMETEEIRKIIYKNIDVLAEAEHNGWMVSKMMDGWRYAKIDDQDKDKKLHPLLLPYAQLSESEKNKDRNPIKGFGYLPEEAEKLNEDKPIPGYVERLDEVGYRIVKLDPSEE